MTDDGVHSHASLEQRIAALEGHTHSLVEHTHPLIEHNHGSPEPPPPPVGKLLFVADAEAGDPLKEWCYVHSGVPVGVATSPVRSGKFSFRSEVQDGVTIFGTDYRSLYANGPGACSRHRYQPGDETWTAVSFYLDPTFPVYSRWSLVIQWKAPHEGTPPQQLNLQADTWSIVGSNTLSPRPRWPVGKVERGRWVDWLFHHRWSSDPAQGFVEVFRDGQLVLPQTFTRTMDSATPLYIETGQYRDPLNKGTAILFIDDLKVGTTREVVA
jgi:hypothetical protein